MKAAKQQEYGIKTRVWYSLYDRLLHADVLETAFKKVKSSNGAPGIDGQSCKSFALNRTDEIAVLLDELRRVVALVEINGKDVEMVFLTNHLEWSA